MSHQWDARLYLLEYAHRWPYAILAFLVGCLLGIAFSYIVPSPTSAETTLIVTYNSDAEFRNPDDYKNYQMGQLNALIVAPDVIQETHDRLKQHDPYWQGISTDELTQSLKLYWRNTGNWRLSAENPSAEHASQALETWMDVFLVTYHGVTSAATDVITMSKRLDELNAQQAQAKTRHRELTGVQEGLVAWQVDITGLPDDLPIDTMTRWNLAALAARASGYDPAWAALLSSLPPPQAAADEYLTWLHQSLASLEIAISTLELQIEGGEQDIVELETMYQEAIDSSRGLSAFVFVERGSGSAPAINPLRQPGLTALIGGLIGLIIWMVVGLVRMSIKAAQ